MAVLNFFENLRKYLQLKVHHTTGAIDTGGKITAGVVDTGGNMPLV